MKISDKKGYMLPGIYEAVDLVASKAINQEDFNLMEDIFVFLVEADPKLYKPKIWLARSLSDDDYNISLSLLEEAIKIAPAQDEAYREFIRIVQNTNNSNIYLSDSVKKYCKIYNNAQAGGLLESKYIKFNNLFSSNNSKKFAVKFSNSNNDNLYYYHPGIQINKTQNYEFIPNESININGIDMYFNLSPGTVIDIKQIIIFLTNKVKKIKSDKFSITSRSSYIFDGENSKIFTSQYLDEVIRVRFNKEIFEDGLNYTNKIEKINILMNFSKMKLTNKSICP